jgi:phage recombination protein Bet
MVEELMRAEYEADGEKMILTKQVVFDYLTGGKEVPDVEVVKFIQLCRARQLNPFTGDVFLIPRWDNKANQMRATITTSRDFFQRRADLNEDYNGMEAGIVVAYYDEDHAVRTIERKGTVYSQATEKLVGGWACVYRKSREYPVYASVLFSEYDTGLGLWKTKPATMIQKTAESQALRKAFPNSFTGLYTYEEMGDENPDTIHVEATQTNEEHIPATAYECEVF